MPLTRDFKQTIRDRVLADADFGPALLSGAVELFLAGDVETGKSVLRDYINATIGFEALSQKVGTPAKSLMRMFGSKGNPRADNLFRIISELQQSNGVQLAVGVAA
jgi:DNA-binding phage protein